MGSSQYFIHPKLLYPTHSHFDTLLCKTVVSSNCCFSCLPNVFNNYENVVIQQGKSWSGVFFIGVSIINKLYCLLDLFLNVTYCPCEFGGGEPTSEAAEKATRWLWLKRADLWVAAGTQART